MHVAFGRTVLFVLGLMLMPVVAGCAVAPVGPTVPTFSDAAVDAGSVDAATGPDDGAVPDDCTRLITVGDLGALLGLPLDSVAVRTTRHVGSPAVGRTERVACDYTGQGAVRGRLLLIDASSYVSQDAARAQWTVNVGAEGEGAKRELAIGAASAVLVEKSGESVLRVVHGASNLVFVLPHGQSRDGRAPADTLVDLALRVMPAVDSAPSGPPASDTPLPPTSSLLQCCGWG